MTRSTTPPSSNPLEPISQKKLPLPVWCFVLLGVPTFYMLLAALVLFGWGIQGILLDRLGDPPGWLTCGGQVALYVTYVMWPVYIAWVLFSRRLTGKEKALWLFLVLYLNMVGMAVFYVFMIRRYLGLEGRVTKRDEIGLDRFMERHALSRERFSEEQLSVLHSHLRRCRQARWSLLVTIPAAAFILYGAVVFLPNTALRFLPEFMPMRTIIVNAEAETREEILPEPEAVKVHTQLVMMFGAMAGMMGVMSLTLLMMSIVQARGNWERSVLIEFVKATGARDPHPSVRE